jgi:hypothetical protein
MFLAGVLALVLAWHGFAAPVRYATTARTAVVAGDLNGDGRPEIVVSGNQVEQLATLSMLVNRGDGTFENERLIPCGLGEKIEDAGDLDDNGVADLLASNYWSNGISLYRGDRSLTFERREFLGTATHGGPSKIMDLDGDGIPDLLSLSFGSGNPVRVHQFMGVGRGAFGPKTTFDTDLAVGASLSTRRRNGVLELLVAEHSSNLGLMRLTSEGVETRRLDAGPGFALSCVFADVNNDGIADIIDSGDEEGVLEPVFVTLGAADGTFLERKRIGSGRHLALPVKVRAGDVDGDGAADLVVRDFVGGTLSLFLGDGRGNFNAEPIPLDAGAPVNDFELADVNGDGTIDVVTANDDHTVSVLVNLGRFARRRAARP